MKKVFYFLTFLFLIVRGTLAQSLAGDSIGDFIKESIPVYDTANTLTHFKIPAHGNYILVYRYRWKNVDNADSVRLLEEKISSLLLGGMVGNLKVVCLAYDRGSDYQTWLNNINKSKPFKSTGKYKVEYFNLNGLQSSYERCQKLFTKLTLFGPDGRLLRHASSIGKFNYHMREESLNLKGKVVTVNNGVKEPLREALIHIEGNAMADTLAKSVSDVYGDFELRVPNSDTSYTIKATPKNKDIKNVMLLTREGKEISYLQKSFRDFEYKLLKADILEMREMPEEADITLSVRNFGLSKNNEMMIVEDILYESQKYEVDKSSEERLNHIAQELKQNPSLKLEVISHTDSQGDDNFNLHLSEKRAGAVALYLVKQGVDEKRIKVTGKGETQIRNRCFNDVQCSDREHAWNRRTEFKFIK